MSLLLFALVLLLFLLSLYSHYLFAVSILPIFIIKVEPCTTCTFNHLLPCSMGIESYMTFKAKFVQRNIAKWQRRQPKYFFYKNIISFLLDYYIQCLKKDERLPYDYFSLMITFRNVIGKWNGLIRTSNNNFGSFSTKIVKMQTS